MEHVENGDDHLALETTNSEGESSTGVEAEDVSTENAITQPFDPTLIRVESKPMSIDLLLTRIREHEIDLAPDFQRKPGIWKAGAKGRLIESILIRIPLPAFYMDATDEGRWLVVDGLQRLTTLKDFAIENTLRLEGLEFLTELHDKTFDQLPRHFQRRILETQIVVYLIEKGTPSKVKFNIFKRINTGGLPLSAQEIRHALNQGPGTRFLAELASTEEFKRATDYGIRDDRMADRECALRFVAFTMTDPEDYRAQDFDSFLNECLTTMNVMSETELEQLRRGFVRAMNAAERLFGRDAFRKLANRRAPLNKALFETWSVNLARLTEPQLIGWFLRPDVLRTRFAELLTNSDFQASISQSTGDPNRVRRRFLEIRKLLQEVVP